jgi:hypothetical protein
VWAEQFSRKLPQLPFRTWPEIGDARGSASSPRGSRRNTSPRRFRTWKSCSRWERVSTSSTSRRCLHICLERRVFDALPEGAALVNAGRGGHLVQADLLAALDDGRLSAAILDVCEPEPLPQAHPFWDHPGIWLTPHVASATQAETGAEALLDNLRRYQAGLPLEGVVDRARSY